MPYTPLTEEQFNKAIDSGFTPDEIIGFEKQRKAETIAKETPAVAGLPKLGETEQKISQRPEAIGELGKELAYNPNPLQHPIDYLLKPLTTAVKAINVPLQKFESPIASAGLALQRGKPLDIGKDIASSIMGKRQAQLGDIVRTTGFGGAMNEPISAITGALGLAGAGNLATTGKIAPAIQNTLASQGVKQGLKTTGEQAVSEAKDLSSMIKGGAKKIGQFAKEKKPEIMGEKWFEKESKLAQNTASGLEKMRSVAYENVYNKINHASVDPLKIDEILRKYDLVDELGSPGAMDVKSAKAFNDQLSQYIPQQVKQGKVFGKGGYANPKIRAEKASQEIKDLIYKSAQEAEKNGIVVKGASQELKDLDKLSSEKLYPRAEKIRKIGGYDKEPTTGGVSGAYKVFGGSEGKVGERLAIKRTPEALKELDKFIPEEKKFDLSEALKSAEQLKKDMGKYRFRQQAKIVTTGGGGLALADFLLRRKIANKVLGQ